MQLTEHFTLEELCASHTASALGVKNDPPKAVVEALTKLTEELLEPLRKAYGKPLRINSGYRCEALNRAVGGVASSQHRKGEAADVACDDPRMLLEVLLASGIVFDQAILYPSFLHVSRKRTGADRGQVLYKSQK